MKKNIQFETVFALLLQSFYENILHVLLSKIGVSQIFRETGRF